MVDKHLNSSKICDGITAKEPVTIPQFFKETFMKWPEVKALCWKDKKGEPWKSLTYKRYKQLVYNVAKSFLKVMYWELCMFCM